MWRRFEAWLVAIALLSIPILNPLNYRCQVGLATHIKLSMKLDYSSTPKTSLTLITLEGSPTAALVRDDVAKILGVTKAYQLKKADLLERCWEVLESVRAQLQIDATERSEAKAALQYLFALALALALAPVRLVQSPHTNESSLFSSHLQLEHPKIDSQHLRQTK